MWGSAVVYAGIVAAAVGFGLTLRPVHRLRVTTRRRGLAVAASGLVAAGVGLFLPAWDSQAARVESRLDEFAPVWQFREVHAIRIDAPPARVYEAITRVRADEIRLFRTLTWIRRGGRQAPPSILNPGADLPVIDVATRSGFVRLADEAPRELVIGTVVLAPAGTSESVTPAAFGTALPAGFALATLNFLVRPDGGNGSLVSTETRVFASGARARRRFGAYWRIIYPGSALIRRMWLRAIRRRATAVEGT